MTLYNEWEPKAAAWLRELVKQGHLPAGEVDERSIEDVRATDLPATAHLFAGIGGWAYALRLAGWPDGQPVWTASLPCQPFSSAGKGKGVDDDRHLWPVVRGLIDERRPPVIFGEQVASPAGRAWFSAVRLDLEALGYGVGCADLCAASAGAPHIRQRLYWGAYRVGCGDGARPQGRGVGGDGGGKRAAWATGVGGGLGDADMLLSRAKRERRRQKEVAVRPRTQTWTPAGFVLCADGRARPVAPIARRVDHGVPERVGLLRGYGNAIVPQLAAVFVTSFVEAMNLQDQA